MLSQIIRITQSILLIGLSSFAVAQQNVDPLKAKVSQDQEQIRQDRDVLKTDSKNRQQLNDLMQKHRKQLLEDTRQLQKDRAELQRTIQKNKEKQ